MPENLDKSEEVLKELSKALDEAEGPVGLLPIRKQASGSTQDREKQTNISN